MGIGGRLARRYVFGRSRFEPAFRRLHQAALAGLNFGAPSPATSGEAWVLDHLAEMTTADTLVVFDVGANVGDYAQEVLRRLDRVRLYCFEPSPSAFARLSRAVADKRAILRPYGLSSSQATKPLYADSPGSGLASVYPRDLRHVGLASTSTETAQLRRLDDVCAEEGAEAIDLLKLDVEGHELDVLRGAERMLATDAIQAIQFEFGGANIDSRTYLRDFFALLGDRFRIHRILKDGLVPLETPSETDEIFVTANYLCLRRPR